jgi:hypothetical protein
VTERIVLLLASRRDAPAAALAARAADAGVRLMTPHDLSQEGWTFHLGDPSGMTAVLAGRPLRAAAIAGVVTRLAGVTEDDLPHIAPEDRGYVAAEMNAFLLAWLTSLACPLVNRPTPQCLSGPHWRQERWVIAAERLGIPARPVVRRAGDGIGPASARAGHVVTVVGSRHFGTDDAVLAQRAYALADAAGVELLAVEFDGPRRDARFVDASLWPDLRDGAIADAVLALVRRKGRPPHAAPPS